MLNKVSIVAIIHAALMVPAIAQQLPPKVFTINNSTTLVNPIVITGVQFTYTDGFHFGGPIDPEIRHGQSGHFAIPQPLPCGPVYFEMRGRITPQFTAPNLLNLCTKHIITITSKPDGGFAFAYN